MACIAVSCLDGPVNRKKMNLTHFVRPGCYQAELWKHFEVLNLPNEGSFCGCRCDQNLKHFHNSPLECPDLEGLKGPVQSLQKSNVHTLIQSLAVNN